MNKTYDKKLKMVKKLFKKKDLFLELYLENYNNYYLYFRIDHNKMSNSYRLSWVDLDWIDSNKIDNYICSEYISLEEINELRDITSKICIKYNDRNDIDSNIHLYVDNKTDCESVLIANFKDYIPYDSLQLAKIIIRIFDNIPRKVEYILFKMMAELSGDKEKYEYKKDFSFDLFNDDLNEIFDYKISGMGQEYYNDGSILFLEKINDTYIAIVEGTEDYVVFIKYDVDKKIMRVYCSCPCEFYCKHMYAVILSIRNNKFRKFFRIAPKKKNQDMLDRLMNLDYYLCFGVDEEDFEIINNQGEIAYEPIFDDDGNDRWIIVYDENNYLANITLKTL